MTIRGFGLACTCVYFAAAALDARAQLVPPQTESVVVTTTTWPQDEAEVGAATTVFDRERIEASGVTNVADLLRLTPGVDVVRSGEDGAVTSLFLRGANSTQALILVDGVRVNSPYFSGYDFSALTIENVERVEVVRGPFSALYGSDAMGGVVQIFTRPPSDGTAASVTLGSGENGWQNGSVFASSHAGPVALTATYGGSRSDGSRANSDWEQDNGSLRVEGRPFGVMDAALEFSLLDGASGVPGAVGAETPEARGTFREERIALPVTFAPSEGHQATIVLAHVRSAPTYRDPNDPFFGVTDTDARTLQSRVSDTWKAGRHQLTALMAWEQWTVESGGSAGTSIQDGDRTSIFGAAIQDVFSLGRGWSAAAGVRVDDHSEFGGAVNPRLSASWLSHESRWKARMSAGSAFRAPSIGELYYPFLGNPDLEPEQSRSYEAGVERYWGSSGRAEVSVFWNDFRDLIVYDFAASRNENVGRALTRGVEVAMRHRIAAPIDLDVGYTYLTAEDQTTGNRLNRRPRHRAYLAATVRPWARWLGTLRATYTGARPDVDGVTFAPVEDPSYLRFDLLAQFDAKRFRPFVRVDNLTDEEYEEADGYPATGRRFVGGIEVRFGSIVGKKEG